MLQTNVQPISKPEHSPDGLLGVNMIWGTVQGEGPYAGMPATFVRLQGCNLQCVLCDTEYTSGVVLTPNEIVSRIHIVRPSKHARLVVFTGGEPFRQNIAPVVKKLVREDFLVQIETNGTLWREEFNHKEFPTANMHVVCSPKTKIHPAVTPWIKAYKYVIESGFVSLEDGLPTRVLGRYCDIQRPHAGFPKEHIYVQPCDVQDEMQNKRNIQAALDSCFHFGYRMCLQTHKILGLR